MNWLWRICGRFYMARHRRSVRLATSFKKKAEKFFRRIKGQS
jgi:hypothetical protein